MITQEMQKYFLKRTENHISLVKKNLQYFINNWYYPHGLKERANCHDKSKFEEPERTGYIYRTWKSYCVLNNIEFKFPEEIIQESTNHHIKNNSHHPEFHNHPDDMTEMDMIEMVCDWTAMGEEFGEKSIKVFADKVLGSKYLFHDENIKKIYSYINLLEEFKNHNNLVCSNV